MFQKVSVGHWASASELQRETEAVLKACGVAAAEVWPEAGQQHQHQQQTGDGGAHRFGPDATTADIVGGAGIRGINSYSYMPPMHLLGTLNYPI